MNIQKINNWFEKRADGIIKNRWLIIVTSIVLVGIAFMGLPKVEMESSWDGYFLEGDPMLVKTDEFKEIFGNDEFVAILTECDNTFSKESLELIRELSNELMDSLAYAEKITSLTDIEFMTGTEYGMQIEQIVPDVIPSDPALLDSIRQKVYSKPNIARKLVSKDGRLSWILLKLRTFPKDSVWKQTSNIGPDMLTGQQTEHIISKEKYSAISPRATGMPYLSTKKQHFFAKEMGRVMGLAILLAIVVLAFATKSIRGVLFPLLTSIAAVVMLYGLTGHIGYKIDSSMTSIPVILAFAIAIAYNIHLFSYFKKQFTFHGKRKVAVKEAVTELGWPILFSALTTMSALLTFLVIPMKPLRFVGIGTASCVLFTLLMVLFLVPALLSFGKDKEPHPVIRQKGGCCSTAK
ncbi:efflux RND transporter permease subunit [Saccharicrinis fermentans]|uniref:Putative exporter n=1 Tax=Saccharicrinis fermentans DSM 9555 = JCM 21142 TaxID=869213 RepID=W7Y175_9BACT|nr:MMPL family transporter [Saccharicrinis fermentans]GAF04665.1 putative exporter [Saccharicrinis fermentans DSM 9555 = JCM 21142]